MGVKIRFYDCEESNPFTFLECAVLDKNNIGIRIQDFESLIPVILDKPTAIRLVRELRKHISQLD